MTSVRLCRGRAVLPLVSALLATKAVSLAHAQQPIAQPPPSTIAAYRAPVIALVQPPGGGTIPEDKPVLVFRFASAEAEDPLDGTSLRVLVNGVDQTARFQSNSTEAWGSIGDATTASASIELGPRQVVARICSVRGACAETAHLVTVVPSLTGNADDTRSRAEGKKERVLDALLAAVRKLLTP